MLGNRAVCLVSAWPDAVSLKVGTFYLIPEYGPQRCIVNHWGETRAKLFSPSHEELIGCVILDLVAQHRFP